MSDFIITDGVLIRCKSNLINALLSNEVVVVGEEAFLNINNLKIIKFTDKLKKISTRAFADCTKLQQVILVETDGLVIEDGAFTNCTNLDEKSKEIINSINPAAIA